MRRLPLFCLLAFTAVGCGSPESATDTTAEPQVLNVYSTRHYDADDALFDRFEEETGIQVNVIEGESAALFERLSREGEDGPADVFITVDAGRLTQAAADGLFQPAESDVLAERVPENLRDPDNLWFGLTKRARVIVYNKDSVSPEDLASLTSYEDLTDPRWQDRVLIRSSGNIYNLSLMGAMIAADGEQAVEQWCRGLVTNLAREPEGGDKDQIRAVAAGEGDVAVVNTYYLAQMLTDDENPADKEAAASIGVIFPNQDGRGTHVNISGAGVVKGAPNPENAVRFIEFLTSEPAQQVVAGANGEYPVVSAIEPVPELVAFGEFKSDPLPASVFGANNKQALMVADRCGWR